MEEVNGDFFWSLAENDDGPIVICDKGHRIVYMNPVAKERYAKRGGGALVGRSLLDCHSEESRRKIEELVEWFGADRGNNFRWGYYFARDNADVYMIALRDRRGELIGYYEKHEVRTVLG